MRWMTRYQMLRRRECLADDRPPQWFLFNRSCRPTIYTPPRPGGTAMFTLENRARRPPLGTLLMQSLVTCTWSDLPTRVFGAKIPLCGNSHRLAPELDVSFWLDIFVSDVCTLLLFTTHEITKTNKQRNHVQLLE